MDDICDTLKISRTTLYKYVSLQNSKDNHSVKTTQFADSILASQTHPFLRDQISWDNSCRDEHQHVRFNQPFSRVNSRIHVKTWISTKIFLCKKPFSWRNVNIPSVLYFNNKSNRVLSSWRLSNLPELLRVLYLNHRQGLFSLALSITGSRQQAEDAVHEAFAKMAGRKLPEGDPVPYVFKVVRNAAIDMQQSRGCDWSTRKVWQLQVLSSRQGNECGASRLLCVPCASRSSTETEWILEGQPWDRLTRHVWPCSVLKIHLWQTSLNKWPGARVRANHRAYCKPLFRPNTFGKGAPLSLSSRSELDTGKEMLNTVVCTFKTILENGEVGKTMEVRERACCNSHCNFLPLVAAAIFPSN